MSVKAPAAWKFLVACSGCKRQFNAGGLVPGSRFRCSCGRTVEVPTPRTHDADVVRCSSCSAPRVKGATSCAHCGSEYTLHERDLHTICPCCMTRISDRSRFCHQCGTPIVPQGTAGRPTETGCPVCGRSQKLNSREMGDGAVSVLECPRCAGLWVGAETFRIIAERARESASSTDLVPGGEASKSRNQVRRQGGPMYRRCPECGKTMHRRNFGRRSGVVIDSCKDHGIWFDANELERILRWIRRGGEARSRERDRVEQEARRARHDRVDVQLNGWKALTDSSSGGSAWGSSSGGLLAGVLGSLFRG